ncbi:hypothetical protein VTO42DRAFT_3340 [Malbranchea cinnamomea]
MPAAKSTFLFAIFSFCSAVLAVPPACLLAAVNTQPDQGDLDTICGKNSIKVQEEIVKACDNKEYLEEALEAFATACEESGNEVALIDIETLSPSATQIATSTNTLSPPTDPTTTSISDGGDDDTPSPSESGSAEAPEFSDTAHIHGVDAFIVAAAAIVAGLTVWI